MDLSTHIENGHPNRKDRDMAIKWARKHLGSRNSLILDTETTGLGKKDEIIEIAIIDMTGRALINQRIRPKRKSISREASEIHGIKIRDLEDEPRIIEVAQKIRKALGGKSVLAYNAAFDARMLQQSINAWAETENVKIGQVSFECAMDAWSIFVGIEQSIGVYKKQKLPGAQHGALADCLAVLEILKFMASQETEPTLKERIWSMFS